MKQRARLWQIVLAVVLLAAAVAGYGWRMLQPSPIRARSVRGARPTYYEAERGPQPELLKELKRLGEVPPDAVDDGKGHFLLPSQLTPADLEYAREAAERQAAWRRRRSLR